ncbi:hypothetical protein VPH35_044294 [Triticum aestivum]
MTENSSLEVARPAIRRKFNTIDVENDFVPIELDVPLHVVDLSGAVLDGVLSGHIDHGLGDLHNLTVDDYSVSGSTSNPTIVSPRLDSNLPPTTDALNTLSAYTHEDALFVDEETSTQLAMPSTDVSSITECFVETIDKALARATEGLNDSTIADPQCHDILQAVYLMLEMQGARKGIADHSQKQAEAVNAAETESGLLGDTLKATSKEILALKKQREQEEKVVEDLGAKLKAATSTLQVTDEVITELESKQSAKQSEAKVLREKLLEFNAKGVQELKVLEEKVSSLSDNIASIIGNLKNWRVPMWDWSVVQPQR